APRRPGELPGRGAPESPAKPSRRLAPPAEDDADHQPDHEAEAARPPDPAPGHVQKRIVEEIVGRVQAGDQPSASFFDQRGAPPRVELELPAAGQLEMLDGAAEGDAGVAAVEDGELVHLDVR